MILDTEKLPASCPTLETVSVDFDSGRKRLIVQQRGRIPPTYQKIGPSIFPGRMVASLPCPTRFVSCEVLWFRGLAAFTFAQAMGRRWHGQDTSCLCLTL